MSLQEYACDEDSYDERQRILLKEIRKQFEAFDLDCTGTIRKHELLTAAQRLGINMTREEAQAIMEKHDKDGSNSIGRGEYERMMLTYIGCLEMQNQRLSEAFDKFDKDGSGKISKNELSKYLLKVGEAFTEEELSEFLSLGDLNEDGLLDKAEFVKLLSVDPGL